MIAFSILKQSKKSRARLGILKTEHGVVSTPCLVPVATQGVVKTLTAEQAEQSGCQILIANAFHLHIKPGEHVVKNAGGLHTFMNWKRPLMTDSGGFQVFSLGFGKDMQVGKILKYFPGAEAKRIGKRAQPQSVKITEQGVWFQSPIDGKKLFLGPKESIRIQEQLAADIIFAFDECTSPLASRAYAASAMNRTHRWARQCLAIKRSKQALFGIVQGSHIKALRQESAQYIGSLDFDGFGIGGDLGKSKQDTQKILDWTIPHLPASKPRHLLGIGHLEDMEHIIKGGIDLFDCTVPTHYARRGIAFTSLGKLNMRQSQFLKDKKPLDKTCSCFVCQNYKRNYLAHLIRAKEITGLTLLTFHNLHFFNSYVEQIRAKIKQGRL